MFGETFEKIKAVTDSIPTKLRCLSLYLQFFRRGLPLLPPPPLYLSLVKYLHSYVPTDSLHPFSQMKLSSPIINLHMSSYITFITQSTNTFITHQHALPTLTTIVHMYLSLTFPLHTISTLYSPLLLLRFQQLPCFCRGWESKLDKQF